MSGSRIWPSKPWLAGSCPRLKMLVCSRRSPAKIWKVPVVEGKCLINPTRKHRISPTRTRRVCRGNWSLIRRTINSIRKERDREKRRGRNWCHLGAKSTTGFRRGEPAHVVDLCGRGRAYSGRAPDRFQKRAAARNAFLHHFPLRRPLHRPDHRTRANLLAAFAAIPPEPASNPHRCGVAALSVGNHHLWCEVASAAIFSRSGQSPAQSHQRSHAVVRQHLALARSTS